MTRALVSTQIRLRQLVANREGGQGTLEYVGMIVVAALIVVAVMNVLVSAGIAAKFKSAVDSVLNHP